MSITFSLPSNETLWPACPACGGKGVMSPTPDPECGHPDCLGYGPERINSTPTLNVCDTNAMVLLRDVLQYQNPECYGSLPAADLGIRLTMATRRLKDSIREEWVEGNVVHGALTIDQLARYIMTLAKMGALALRRGETVNYG